MSIGARHLIPLALVAVPCFSQKAAFNEKNAQDVVKQHCLACHRGKGATAKFDVAPIVAGRPMAEDPRKWTRLLARVRNGEMPPQNAPPIDAKLRETFVDWLDHSLRTAACADGIAPGPAFMRRLNRNEYSATVRDLLNIHMNAAQALPADGAGGEGFDNAARSEEHTSELQSRLHLVCRLLLEKK